MHFDLNGSQMSMDLDELVMENTNLSPEVKQTKVGAATRRANKNSRVKTEKKRKIVGTRYQGKEESNAATRANPKSSIAQHYEPKNPSKLKWLTLTSKKTT